MGRRQSRKRRKKVDNPSACCLRLHRLAEAEVRGRKRIKENDLIFIIFFMSRNSDRVGRWRCLDNRLLCLFSKTKYIQLKVSLARMANATQSLSASEGGDEMKMLQ